MLATCDLKKQRQPKGKVPKTLAHVHKRCSCHSTLHSPRRAGAQAGAACWRRQSWERSGLTRGPAAGVSFRFLTSLGSTGAGGATASCFFLAPASRAIGAKPPPAGCCWLPPGAWAAQRTAVSRLPAVVITAPGRWKAIAPLAWWPAWCVIVNCDADMAWRLGCVARCMNVSNREVAGAGGSLLRLLAHSQGANLADGWLQTQPCNALASTWDPAAAGVPPGPPGKGDGLPIRRRQAETDRGRSRAASQAAPAPHKASRAWLHRPGGRRLCGLRPPAVRT